MKVSMCTQFLKMQGEALDFLMHLIDFDKEMAEKNGEQAEKTLPLKAFVDTQRKALNMAELLLNKHKESLLEIEKKAEEEEKKKREAEMAKKKAETKKAKVKEDLKKAKSDENSLFAEMEEQTEETGNADFDQFENSDEEVDDYGFEETD